ncbi:MAG: hypothetical protein ACRDLP_15915 [Solirubrobacteraceae bacterium]
MFYAGRLELETLRGGLWRWTAPHPDWRPIDDDGEPASWPAEVGCVLYASERHAAFIDPLAVAATPSFWSWAQERCSGREVAVLETISFHRRSRDEFITRFSASTEPPPSVIAHPLAVAEEVVYWLPEHRTLVPGDALVSNADGELSLCPPSWLDYLAGTPDMAAMRDALRPLLELDIEIVLTSHGEPVRSQGHAALARALDTA